MQNHRLKRLLMMQKTKRTKKKIELWVCSTEIEKEAVNAKKSLEKDFATNVMAAAKKIISGKKSHLQIMRRPSTKVWKILENEKIVRNLF